MSWGGPFAFWKIVEYSQTVTCGGRNGTTLCAGVSVEDYSSDTTLRISGLNSKGRITAGSYIEIPKVDLPNLIAALQKVIAGPLGRLALDAEASQTATTVEDNADGNTELGDPAGDQGQREAV